jgi:hypothetical protein
MFKLATIISSIKRCLIFCSASILSIALPRRANTSLTRIASLITDVIPVCLAVGAPWLLIVEFLESDE